MNEETLKLVEKVFFEPYPFLSIGSNLEGNKVRGPSIKFGCRAGLSKDFSNLFHEMSHFIICPKSKILLPSWGLKYKKTEGWFDRYGYHEYVVIETYQDVKTEIKTLVWQSILHRAFQVGSIDEHIDALSWLEGWGLYEAEFENKQDAIKKTKTYIYQKSLNYSFKDFMKRWRCKANYLKKYQTSKEKENIYARI